MKELIRLVFGTLCFVQKGLSPYGIMRKTHRVVYVLRGLMLDFKPVICPVPAHCSDTSQRPMRRKLHRESTQAFADQSLWTGCPFQASSTTTVCSPLASLVFTFTACTYEYNFSLAPSSSFRFRLTRTRSLYGTPLMPDSQTFLLSWGSRRTSTVPCYKNLRKHKV